MEPNKQTTGGDPALDLPTADELEEHLLPTAADYEALEAHLRANAMQVGVVGDSSSQPQPHHHVVEERLRAMQFGGDSSSSQLQPHHRAGGLVQRPAYDGSWRPQFHFQPQASSYVEFSPPVHIGRLAHDSWRSQFQPQASSYGDHELHPDVPLMNAPAARTPSMPNAKDVRDLLLREPKDQNLLMSANTSAHVVELLKERRDEEVRKAVLFMARGVVHRIMESREGNDVFVALLQACAGKFDELGVIVNAVCNGKGFLMLTVLDNLGEKAVKDLIEAVASARDLRLRLAHGLFSEGVMERSKGPVLLRHCLANLPEEDREIIIQLRVLNAFDKISSSPFGWRCLEVCLAYPTNDKVMDLEETIVSRTSVIAKDPRRYRLLLDAILNGSEQLKARIAEHVGANILELSVHEFGHYVVEACILQPSPPQVLQLVLSAIRDLHDDALQEMVRGLHSSNVVVQLLTTGKQTFPGDVTALAKRIFRLPAAAVRAEEQSDDLVMRAICRLFYF